MSPLESWVTEQLITALNPKFIEIIDETAEHLGHAQQQLHGGAHFYLKIISDKFQGLTMLQRHRLIYKILQSKIKTEIHALSICALSSKEQ